jgi:quercetin dioxygenase-like cupin family protein
MQIRMLTLLMVLTGATVAAAEDMRMPVNTSQLKWGPAPDALPKGAQIAVLSGDPAKDGLYVVRLRLPAGYKVPAHNHPTAEMVTVMTGKFHLGMGDKLDEKKAMLLTAGGFAEAPAKMNHYAWTTGPTVLQIHGQGPFEINYVNPADDPRGKSHASK